MYSVKHQRVKAIHITCILVMLFSTLGCSFVHAGNIDTKHIKLDLQINWEKKQVYGTETFIVNVIAPADSLTLDIGMLSITSVKLHQQNLTFTLSDSGRKLLIHLDKVYSPKEEIQLDINYHTLYQNHSDPYAIGGSFGKGLRFMQPTEVTPTKNKQIWSSGEPMGNAYWFPCHEDFADIHTTEIKMRVEKPLSVIASGELKHIEVHEDNTRTFHYHSTKAYPNYLVSLVVGEYQEVVQHANKTTIHHYAYPHELDAVKATTVLVPDMLQFLEEKTGYPYPFGNYTQVVVQDYPFPGLVGQHKSTLLSDNYIDDYKVHEEFKYLWDGVAVQALANQWFGNLIMPASWQDAWLNQSFAQYFAGLYTTSKNGKAEYLLWYYPFEKGAVQGDWEAGYIHPIVTSAYDDVGVFSSDNYTKFRGALVLRMLQHELGDALWWKAMQYYVRTNAYRQVTTKDFQQAIEKMSGTSYQWFFDQWIYNVGMPTFQVTYNYNESTKKLQLGVKQSKLEDIKTAFTKVPFFKGKIDIEINGERRTITLEPKEEQTIILDQHTTPSYLHFNSEHIFLCRYEFQQSKEECIQQVKQSTDYAAKQWALDALVTFAADSNCVASCREKIAEVIRREVRSAYYWRYRQYALGSLRKITPLPYDKRTKDLLLQLIKTESRWLKASAINMLGATRDIQYIPVYKTELDDSSDRVINAAAIALGKTKDSSVYPILLQLDKKPSWKNQSRISALNGLEQLGDTQAVNYVLDCIQDNHSPRWFLATPMWDYPFAAVITLSALGKSEKAYSILYKRFEAALKEDDRNDIFQLVQLINALKDKRATEMYGALKEKFKEDTVVMGAITYYESLFLESINSKP